MENNAIRNAVKRLVDVPAERPSKRLKKELKAPVIEYTTKNVSFIYTKGYNVSDMRKYLCKADKTLRYYESTASDPKWLINRIRETDEDLYAHIPKEDKSCVGICYSGGYDSVLLIARAAEEGKTIIPIRLGANSDFKGVWVMAELALLQLRRKYPHRICKAITPIANIEYSWEEEFCGYRLQPSIAFSLGFMGDRARKAISEIQMGFICKDECMSFIPEFEALYKAAKAFAMPYEEEPIPLKYPLKKLVKSMVASELYAKGLYNEIAMVTCEQPLWTIVGNENGAIVYVEQCGSCMSCHTFETADRERKESGLLAVFGNDNMPDAQTAYRNVRRTEKEVCANEIPVDCMDMKKSDVEEVAFAPADSLQEVEDCPADEQPCPEDETPEVHPAEAPKDKERIARFNNAVKKRVEARKEQVCCPKK